MPGPDYHFVTHWRVLGTPEQVDDILNDATDLPRWWPAVYLSVTEEQPANDAGLGQVVHLHTKGWLPYTIRWHMRTTEKIPRQRLALEAWGDFVGTGVWTFEADGEYTNITYDWRISAEKPLFRRLTFLLRPIFSLNHLWAMRVGEESLKRELLFRATCDDSLPPPRRPTSLWLFVVLGLCCLFIFGVVIIGSVLMWLPFFG